MLWIFWRVPYIPSRLRWLESCFKDVLKLWHVRKQPIECLLFLWFGNDALPKNCFVAWMMFTIRLRGCSVRFFPALEYTVSSLCVSFSDRVLHMSRWTRAMRIPRYCGWCWLGYWDTWWTKIFTLFYQRSSLFLTSKILHVVHSWAKFLFPYCVTYNNVSIFRSHRFSLYNYHFLWESCPNWIEF